MVGNTDPAGVMARFQSAAAKGTGLRIRSAHKATAYFEFPVDIVWTRQTDQLVAQLVDEADVLHLNNTHRPLQRFRARKPTLLHHHGSLFRSNPAKLLSIAKAYRMVQAVSTLDLTRPAPELLHWLPTAYDVDDLQRFGLANRREPDGRVRIVHCPTNRTAKNTQTLLDAVGVLLAEGLPVDLVLVEGQTWSQSLLAKAGADIVFDQLAYGYGCNSVEAWGVGVPVVAGADEWTLATMRKTYRKLPFDVATEATLVSVLRRLVTSQQRRDDYAGRGLEFVRRWHDEKPALARLAELYALAITTYHASRIPGKGAPVVTFANPAGRRIWVDDQPLDWVDGRWSGDDPFVITRLRSIAAKHPLWGIHEVAVPGVPGGLDAGTG